MTGPWRTGRRSTAILASAGPGVDDALPRSAWLDVDLDAIRGNMAVIRSMAGLRTPIFPVVKADAYGHGAIEVARALTAAGADGFCVATIDEALVLRAGGIRAPLLVLYPVPPAWVAEAAQRRVSITAGDPDLLAATLETLASRPPRRPLRIQLEVETGLGRGGFIGPALVAAARSIGERPTSRIDGLWTHLQAPEDVDITRRQIEAFDRAATELRAAGVRLPRRHVHASGSLLSDGVVADGGIRPGLSIYGLVPDELAGRPLDPEAAFLRPAMSLRARPVRVADLPAGWGISYGPTYRTTRPTRIATLPLGYGDGWSRALSNRAEALVRGHRVRLVGNVAMDAVMADVSTVPGTPVTVADEFTLFGWQGDAVISVAAVARARGTNSWEVVTGMARRLPRVYHAASGPVVVRTLLSGG
ncbi:MAG: alanine racemase [Chloroflexi bacterium]|nr:alanine racemase [Chloroflexota bacterium]